MLVKSLSIKNVYPRNVLWIHLKAKYLIDTDHSLHASLLSDLRHTENHFNFTNVLLYVMVPYNGGLLNLWPN